MKRLYLALLIIAVSPLFAEPAWLTLERGIEALDDRHPGEALLYFQDLEAADEYRPETAYYIGRIYELEAEMGLAEKQYVKALNLKNQFYNSEFGYQVQYDLANLYYKQNRLQEYNNILLDILQEDPHYNNSDNMRLQTAYLQALEEGGIDKLLLLYRMEPTFALDAHIRLGELYYRQQRYSRALLHDSYAVISQITPLLNDLRKNDPDFRFTSVVQTLKEADRDQEFRDLLRDSDFYKALYYMGASLWALQKNNKAVEVWSILTSTTDSGQWGRMADRQINRMN